MTESKLKDTLHFYIGYMVAFRDITVDNAVEMPDDPSSYSHLCWMCAKAAGFPPEDIDKGMRWLGFVQGCLLCKGCFTLAQLRDHSRGD